MRRFLFFAITTIVVVAVSVCIYLGIYKEIMISSLASFVCSLTFVVYASNSKKWDLAFGDSMIFGFIIGLISFFFVLFAVTRIERIDLPVASLLSAVAGAAIGYMYKKND